MPEFFVTLLPLLAILVFPASVLIPMVVVISLIALVILGCLSAYVGGAPKRKGVGRLFKLTM